ncbi:MAG: hypothetical protein WC099_01025 [Candidatus Paceibacterota bacterium]
MILNIFQKLRSSSNYSVRRGVVSITTVMIIGTVIMETALVGLVVAYLVGEQGMGVRASYSATAAAESGISDVLLHIARNKDWVPSISPYTIQVGSFTVQVAVTKTPIDSRFSQYTVVATGRALTKRVQIQSIFVVDGYLGSVNQQSLTEL